VQDSAFAQRTETGRYLTNDGDRITALNTVADQHAITQSAAVGQRHHQIRSTVLELTGVVDRHYIG